MVDSSKGLRAAANKAFRQRVVVHRCQWHKRENVVSYLSKSEQVLWRRRLQRAYNRPEYKEAFAAIQKIHSELEERNQSAAASLEEGLEETLTLHRLGVYGVLGRSLKTTNCLESVNALVGRAKANIVVWALPSHISEPSRKAMAFIRQNFEEVLKKDAGMGNIVLFIPRTEKEGRDGSLTLPW